MNNRAYVKICEFDVNTCNENDENVWKVEKKVPGE